MKNYLSESGNIHLSYYLQAADQLNIEYEVVTKSLLARFSYGKKHWFIINTVTPLVNSPGKTIALRKDLCNKVLKKANISVPEQATLSSTKEAEEFFAKHKNIVIKPKQGIGGKGITILPSNLDEVKIAFDLAKQHDSSKKDKVAIGEEYASGDNFRLLTLDDKVIGAVKRLPSSITGDGESTIQNLILKNKKIPLDSETQKTVERQGLNLETVLDKNKTIYVRSNTNITTGGTTEEYSEHVHQYYKDIATKAIKAIGIKLGGVDLIAEDITKPAKYAINEINYNPGLRIHYQVDKGEKVPVAVDIMKYLRDNEL